MASRLTISWIDNILTIFGHPHPDSRIDINYLEAFCRPGSADRDWRLTVIPHRTRLVSADVAQQRLQLNTILEDGVIVSHDITVSGDEIDFRLEAHNPTYAVSIAHWAQPCVRVGAFTGFSDHADPYAYIRKCFIFTDGHIAFMPTGGWATQARYTPGQVWRPAHVSEADVNPRPLNPHIPDNGLIGCLSGDGTALFATAWEPYQELFQGVIMCIHADFRIGGLDAGETKHIRGKMYCMENDIEALLKRYARDFPDE